jgi:trans-aconitate methyltransferase
MPDGQPLAQEAREVVERQSRQLSRLTNEVLEMLRLGSEGTELERVPLELGQIASAVAADFERQAVAAGCVVDAWETTYVHQLTGDTPVLDWIMGTALTQVRSRLSDDLWQQYLRDITPMLAQAYPQRRDGTTFFPFRRVFVVARVG